MVDQNQVSRLQRGFHGLALHPEQGALGWVQAEALWLNEETVAATETSRHGDLVAAGDVDGLMADLHADH